jgi:hypothetical protein
MCYSARIIADCRKYTKDYGAEMSIKDFVDLFRKRTYTDPKTKTPKALTTPFSDPRSDEASSAAATAGLVTTAIKGAGLRNRNLNFTSVKIERFQQQVAQNIQRYLDALELTQPTPRRSSLSPARWPRRASLARTPGVCLRC